MAQALIALSDALTLKMSNSFASNGPQRTASSKWLRHVLCRQANRHAQQQVDVLLNTNTLTQHSIQLPAEPPPDDVQLVSVVTGFNNPDHDSASISSTNTFNSQDSNDSLFVIPPLYSGGSVSSSDDKDDQNFHGFHTS